MLFILQNYWIVLIITVKGKAFAILARDYIFCCKKTELLLKQLLEMAAAWDYIRISGLATDFYESAKVILGKVVSRNSIEKEVCRKLLKLPVNHRNQV